jgi:hypothetical protein
LREVLGLGFRVSCFGIRILEYGNTILIFVPDRVAGAVSFGFGVLNF